MGQAKKRGTHEERVSQAIERIQAERLPKQFFGYSRELRPNESPFDISPDGLVCTLTRISQEELDAEQCDPEIDGVKGGDWAFTTGSDDNIVVHNAFGKLEDAFEFGRREVGAIRFIASPSFLF